MFTVQNKVEKAKFEDRYVVEVTGTFVSSPGEAMLIMGGFVPNKDDVFLGDLLDTLERLVNVYKYGRQATDEYYHIPGYETWFAQSSLTKEEVSALPEAIQKYGVEWLADPTGLPGSRATFSSYQLYYYDGDGTKYEVAYTPEQMRQVSSSMINMIGYDAKAKKLRVVFLKGGTYVYSNVEADVYQEMVTSPSVGKYFHANIKPHYDFEKEA